MKTRENAIVDGFDYQIPVTNLKGLKGDDQEYIYLIGIKNIYTLRIDLASDPVQEYIYFMSWLDRLD